MTGQLHTACVGLGSNLGDRRAHLEDALKTLREAKGVRVVACSSFHETEPVGGPPGQPAYLNAAVRIETEWSPLELLHALQELEEAHGRRRAERNAPRTLDLDVLLYEDRVIDVPELEVPHPRMHERMFVLTPLVEIAPEYVHPLLGRTIAELYQTRKDVPPEEAP